jgi:integrase
MGVNAERWVSFTCARSSWTRHKRLGRHISHGLDNGAPISLVSQTVGHADLKTTSAYAHAKPSQTIVQAYILNVSEHRQLDNDIRSWPSDLVAVQNGHKHGNHVRY